MPSNRVVSYPILKKFATLCDCKNSHYTDCFIVSTYLRQNGMRVRRNRLIMEYLVEDANVQQFISYLGKKEIQLKLEDLVAFFEFVISPQDKEVNGAVYTPEHIRECIVSWSLAHVNGPLATLKYADIACGCGGFLITLARHLHNDGIPYATIFRDCLFGVDVANYSITRTKLMLSLLALEEEDVENYHFNLINANSLSFDWNSIDAIREHGGFDVIVGNPPYVGASKIDEDNFELVKRWEVSKSGKADMYIPFFQIAIENLKTGGVLGYITVNNFFRSDNGRALRQYFKRRKLEIRIIDFGSEQVFKGRSTYTCLCFVRNTVEGAVYYIISDSTAASEIGDDSFERFDYQTLKDNAAWTLSSNMELPFIEKVRETGSPLGEYVAIRNGFATLRNEVYLFVPTHADERYYYFEREGCEECVERGICRDAIKGNILRCEDDLACYKEKLIFPYRLEETGIVTAICEEEMITCYPCAYNYLEKNKSTLMKRSKSDTIKPWYSYGRSQALNLNGYKLLFPYIADKPHFILSTETELLFYNGYCMVDKSITKLQYLQKLLNTRLFWHFVQVTSKPYGGRFYALAKNYVKTFGVIHMSEEQERAFIGMSQEDANIFVEELYGVRRL